MALGTGSWLIQVPFTSRPGVRTVPFSLVGDAALHVVGTVLHSEPVQEGPPLTHDCAPVVALEIQAAVAPQLPVQLASPGAQPGQQLSALPQPSEAEPQLWPSWA